jgi:large subunit ribosomal protein L25
VAVKLKAVVRTPGVHSAVTELRQTGQIPGTFYGKKIDAVSLYVDEEQFRDVMHTDAGSNVMIELDLTNDKGDEAPGLKGKQVAMVKELQRNAITGAILHVDFVKVSMSEDIHAAIPVVINGDAAGVKLGGVLQHSVRELNVKCLPGDLPEQYELTVTDLEIGDSIHVRDLTAIPGVEILDDPDEILVSVVPPAKIEEEAPAEEAEAEAEPEVIGEKKEEESEPES